MRLPFLVWAAVRFGSIGMTTAAVVVVLLATRGAVDRLGPFVASTPADSALSIQLCLIFASIPLLLLSAVMQERRRAERSAIVSEESLKLALDAAQMSIWDWSLPPRDASPRREEAPRRSAPCCARCTRPIGWSPTKAVAAAIEQGTPWDVEFRVAQFDGSVRWVMGKGEVLRDDAGRPVRLLEVNVDITDRKRADEALRARPRSSSRAPSARARTRW